MVTNATREEVLTSNLEEEASVLEIHNELVRRITGEDAEGLKTWLKAELASAAGEQRVGFYLDEFGARDVREIDNDEAIALLDQGDIWSRQSETMLHVFLMED